MTFLAVFVVIELFLILIVESFIFYVVNKKRLDPEFTIQDHVKSELKTFKKAWVKKEKRKPQANDDYAAWVQENTKDATSRN